MVLSAAVFAVAPAMFAHEPATVATVSVPDL